MSWLLEERSPRPWTSVYAIHRCRGFLPARAARVLPHVAGAIAWLAAAACVVDGSIVLSGPGWERIASTAAVSAFAACVAGRGMAALWGWIAARLLPIVARHPQSQKAVAKGYRMPARPGYGEPCIVLGEAHCERDYSADGSYALTYRTEDAYSPTPEWAVLPARSAVTGLLILGATGSGKTEAVIKPAVFSVFAHVSKPGGLVIDSKASLVEPLMACLAVYGRSADLVVVGPSSPMRWNPFHAPEVAADVMAEQAVTVLENLNGSPYASDARWIRAGAANLLEGIIGILRLRAGYLTAVGMRALLQQLVQATSGSDNPAQEAAQLLGDLFIGAPSLDAEQEAQRQHFVGLIVERFGEDEKYRSIYSAELNQLLLPLARPAVRDVFNAPESQLNMPGWRECINQGRIVVLDCNAAADPALAIVIGMQLKLGYQNAMLARLRWQRDGTVDANRYMALVIDEAQDYVSPGDVSYLAKCRESRSLTVFATQGLPSIIQQLGRERTDTLVQSLRNRLVLTQTLPDPAADLLGQADFQEIDASISESVRDAELQATGRFAGDSTVAESYAIRRQRRHVVQPETLQKLSVGQAVLQCHDGNRALPVHRIYLRMAYAGELRAAERMAADEAWGTRNA